MGNIIKLNPEAENAIINLQHPAGTYHYYRKTLDRLFTHVLHMSDEMGMSENEAMHTLRALDGLRFDLSKIAGDAAVAGESDPESIAEELAARVHDAFDDFEDSNYPRPLNEAREAIIGLSDSLDRVRQANFILIEAAEHAERAGNADAVTARMAAVQVHFADAASILDEMIQCYSSILQECKNDVATGNDRTQTSDIAE